MGVAAERPRHHTVRVTLELDSLSLLLEAAQRLDGHYARLPATSSSSASPDDDLAPWRAVLTEIADRLGEDFPFAHPLYAGQMLKPPHPLARLAYALATFVNPNAHALDGGRSSSAMEKEAVAELAAMMGFDAHLGHLTGGGTMANLEALWVASRLGPKGGRVLASKQAHYTHERLCQVLGIPFVAVEVDDRGRMDPDALARQLDRGPVTAVVATLGTTGLGAVDPVATLHELTDTHGTRLHVDAAYGGYFRLASAIDDEDRPAFEATAEADSLVVDPHKHGLQPYGCGCVLFADPNVGALYRHDSPYTYFSSDELHLGEISLECSRPGAAAIALWATQRHLRLERGGAFAGDLDRSLEAARALHARLEASERFLTLSPPSLDIVVFAPRGERASAISTASRELFEAAASRDLHLALTSLPHSLVDWPDVDFDTDQVTCLRSVLMKPSHLDWATASPTSSTGWRPDRSGGLDGDGDELVVLRRPQQGHVALGGQRPVVEPDQGPGVGAHLLVQHLTAATDPGERRPRAIERVAEPWPSNRSSFCPCSPR